MTQNTDQENLENIRNTAENPAGERIAITETTNVTTNKKTKTMGVHHHPHLPHGKRSSSNIS